MSSRKKLAQETSYRSKRRGPWNLGETIRVTHPGEKEEGDRKGMLPRGKHAGSSVLRAFKGGDFRRGVRGGSQQNIHQLSRCALSGL